VARGRFIRLRPGCPSAEWRNATEAAHCPPALQDVPDGFASPIGIYFPEAIWGEGEGAMKSFTAVIEKDPETGLYVGYVPGFPGAHSQAETLDELNENLKEVIAMLLEDGEPKLEAEFIGTQTVSVA